jgi:hypothetical protein
MRSRWQMRESRGLAATFCEVVVFVGVREPGCCVRAFCATGVLAWLFVQHDQRVCGAGAALAAPGFEAFADGNGGDQQAGDRVKPPGAERGVASSPSSSAPAR